MINFCEFMGWEINCFDAGSCLIADGFGQLKGYYTDAVIPPSILEMYYEIDEEQRDFDYSYSSNEWIDYEMERLND